MYNLEQRNTDRCGSHGPDGDGDRRADAAAGQRGEREVACQRMVGGGGYVYGAFVLSVPVADA
jgi:hypothetical protein